MMREAEWVVENRAQSESVGVILLVGIVVISVATVGAFALSDIDSDERNFDATVEVTTDRITIAHGGGDPVPFSDLLLVLRVDGTTTRITPNDSELVNGDDDELFEPGERWVTDTVSYSTDELVTVRLFDVDTQLTKDTLYPNTAVATGTTGPAPTDTATPTDSTAPSVTVNAPDGGELFAGGDTTTVAWAASDADSGVSSVDIAYSTDGGANWTAVVANTDDDGSDEWAIPEINTTDARVRVTAIDNAGTTASDRSNSTFTIDSEPPMATLEQASQTGNRIVVRWNASDNYVSEGATVVIELQSEDTGMIYTEKRSITTNTTNETTFKKPDQGTYEVVVIVTDAVAQSDSDTGTITYSGPSGGGGSPKP